MLSVFFNFQSCWCAVLEVSRKVRHLRTYYAKLLRDSEKKKNRHGKRWKFLDQMEFLHDHIVPRERPVSGVWIRYWFALIFMLMAYLLVWTNLLLFWMMGVKGEQKIQITGTECIWIYKHFYVPIHPSMKPLLKHVICRCFFHSINKNELIFAGLVSINIKHTVIWQILGQGQWAIVFNFFL